jgi:hypothetical protein
MSTNETFETTAMSFEALADNTAQEIVAACAASMGAYKLAKRYALQAQGNGQTCEETLDRLARLTEYHFYSKGFHVNIKSAFTTQINNAAKGIEKVFGGKVRSRGSSYKFDESSNVIDKTSGKAWKVQINWTWEAPKDAADDEPTGSQIRDTDTTSADQITVADKIESILSAKGNPDQLICDLLDRIEREHREILGAWVASHYRDQLKAQGHRELLANVVQAN